MINAICNICSRYCIHLVKFTSYCELIECSRPIRFFIVSLMYNKILLLVFKSLNNLKTRYLNCTLPAIYVAIIFSAETIILFMAWAWTIISIIIATWGTSWITTSRFTVPNTTVTSIILLVRTRAVISDISIFITRRTSRMTTSRLAVPYTTVGLFLPIVGGPGNNFAYQHDCRCMKSLQVDNKQADHPINNTVFFHESRTN